MGYRSQGKLSDLNDAVNNVKIEPNKNTLNALQKALNEYYTDCKCYGVIYTENTDKVFFGMCVLPALTGDDAVKILQSDQSMRIENYYIEIDSKLLSPMLGLSTNELTAVLLHEVGHLTNDGSPVDELRDQINMHLATNKEILSISDSIYYRKLLAFACSDALRKITSIFFDEEEGKADSYVIKCGYGEALDSAMVKITKKAMLINSDVKNKFVVLTWALRLYKNIKLRRIDALRTIRKSVAITASELEKRQLRDLDDDLRRIDDASLMESVVLEFTKPNEKFREIKIRGLKGFEQDYYEYNMIRRNITDQDEALWMMREINTRISIIENYLETEKLSTSESKRWSDLFDKYIKLRDDLSSKLVYKDRFVGLQVNYPSIKGLDN